MNHKALIVVATLALLIGGAVWIWSQSTQPSIVQEGPNPVKAPTNLSIGETSGIEGVRDLIDGEYAFTPVDTSDWQTYRNEEAGFEVKIPRNWFCGGVALAPNSRRSFVCLEEKNKQDYYSGKMSNNNLIMVNFPDIAKISTGSLRENLVDARKNGSKIHSLTIDEKGSVLVTKHTRVVSVSDDSNAWNVVVFPSVRKDVLDGFMQSFEFLK